MPTVKTAISLQKPLFASANKLAAEMRILPNPQQLLVQLNAAYDDAPDESEQRVLRGMRRIQRQIVGGEW